MDIITYSLCKRFATKVAAGFSSVTVDEPSSTINFTLNDGKHVSLKVPTPKDGVSVISIVVNDLNHLVINYSDGRSEDIGPLPRQQILISKESGNALQNRKDGLYVSKTGVQISEEEENAIATKDDGLYVPSIDAQKDSVENIVNEVITHGVAEEIDIENLFK